MSTNCGHDHCGRCCGGSCTGCGALELTQDELNALADKVRTETWDKDFEMYGEDAKTAVYADMGW